MRIAFSLSLLAVLASVAALADPPPGTIMKVTPPGPNAVPLPQKICAMQLERNMAMLAQLEKALALTAQQKPLFDAWKKTRVEVMRAWPCPVPSTGPDVPTPTRLDRDEALLTTELEALRKEKPLVGALYEALSPEQRATFDGPPRPAQLAPQSSADKPKPEAPPAH